MIATNNVAAKPNTVQASAQVSQAFYFTKTLAGILNEGWNTIQKSYFKTKLSKKYALLLPDYAKEGLKDLKAYFKGNNMVNDIRNKYSFHYDRDEIHNELDRIPQGVKVKIVASEHVGNTFNQFSETINNRALLNSIDSSSPENAIALLFDDIVLNVPKYLRAFANGFIVICLEQLGFDDKMFNIDGMVAISEIKLPYFLKKDDV